MDECNYSPVKSLNVPKEINTDTHGNAVYSSLTVAVRDARFNQIAKILTSAGETPEMRDACPNVVGRIFESFIIASVRRLGIDS